MLQRALSSEQREKRAEKAAQVKSCEPASSPPAVAARLMGYFASVSLIAKRGPAQFFPELMEREDEILTLIAQRKSNAEIAAHLVLSPKTVRNHVSDRTEAMPCGMGSWFGTEG